MLKELLSEYAARLQYCKDCGWVGEHEDLIEGESCAHCGSDNVEDLDSED